MVALKVRTKTIIINFISVVLLMILMAGVFNIVVNKYTDNVEVKKLSYNFNILQSIIEKDNLGIERTAEDWSNWDESYNFMSGTDDKYFIDTNLHPAVLSQLDLNFMFFIDTKGDLKYGITRYLENNTKDAILSKVSSKKDGRFQILTFKNNFQNKSGILSADGKVFLITATAITTTNGNAESNGNLVIGRKINDAFITYADSLIRGNVVVYECGNIKNGILKTRHDVTENREINDIFGDGSIEATITVPREEYNSALGYLKLFMLIFAASAIVMALELVTAAEIYLISRVRTVRNFVNKVRTSHDTKSVLLIEGSDEISETAVAINNMLKALDDAYEDVKTAEERYKLALDTTNDGYIDYNFQTRQYFISSSYKALLGLPEKTEGIYLIDLTSNITAESVKTLKNKFDEIYNSTEDYFQFEYEIRKKSGEKIWVQHRGKIINRDKNGKVIRYVGVLIDRTHGKNYEEKLINLSYSDKLTGVKNRTYIEMRFEELDKDPESNYSIVIGDLNGLKITNDTFGHHEGDRLIKKTAEILKSVCLNNEIIARWGGDEFVILVEDKPYDYVLELIKSIKEKCDNVSGFKYKMSIALGSASRSSKMNSEAVMNMAEDKMYRSKLIDKSSSRNATIASLEKTLYEKNSETQEHTKRIKLLSKRLGKLLDLSQDKLDELELLSALHDIGKIGIPEQILTKPDSLTNEEWDTMKKHSEIGYRIAMATPGLSHVAFEILCHHERYDGTGYPQGLSGDEIPVLSRIISVVDSFDVMTHKRVYKEAFGKEKAIQELNRCSGTQFDPVIVKEFLKVLNKVPAMEQGEKDVHKI